MLRKRARINTSQKRGQQKRDRSEDSDVGSGRECPVWEGLTGFEEEGPRPARGPGRGENTECPPVSPGASAARPTPCLWPRGTRFGPLTFGTIKQ